jgi:UDP-3-O-[3-hydroxymyristoyl] glucosamine N-acyltransferase
MNFMEYTLSQIVDALDGRLRGNPDKVIKGVAPFEAAGPQDITVAGHPKYLKRIGESAAGAVIVPHPVDGFDLNLVAVEHPMVAFATVVRLFHPDPAPVDRVHPQAVLGRDLQTGRQVDIGPCAVIGNRVRLGNRIRIGAGVVLGDDVTIGDDVVLHPNVTVLERCLIGNRVIIHSGTVIGSDGFGFAPDGKTYHKQPHTGIVRIADDVEIGANNTVDRATFGETRIGCGVKTDNLVQIAHNVHIGDNTVVVSQVGISGSVSIGDNVILAGQAGIAGHLKIGDGAIIGPRAGIAKDVPPGQVIMGAPQMSRNKWLRVQRIVSMLPELKKRLEKTEKRIRKLMPDGGE